MIWIYTNEATMFLPTGKDAVSTDQTFNNTSTSQTEELTDVFYASITGSKGQHTESNRPIVTDRIRISFQ